MAQSAAPSLRLPAGVRPLAYTLELSILPQRERFSGRTQIAVSLDAPATKVWLHGKDLHVTEVSARAGDREWRGTYQQQNEEGLASVTFEQPLPAGRSLLVFRYDAAFNRQLEGLYRVDSGGDHYAFTQFESISARLAFPCFDEPAFKTPFDVWLTVEHTDVALSNTSVLNEERSGEFKRVHFATTKPLPTYLVAFAVGPLDVVETAALPANELRGEPLPLRGVAARGKGAKLAYVLSTLGPTVAALENYFGNPYPFDKLDIVAVPDFAAGAMENAGLVTFREPYLLFDGQDVPEAQKRWSLFVLAHELAHQWVGDLVTMKFWDDIWLNEAFATWLEFRVAGALHPEYKGELELLDDVQGAMENDSRVTARMIRQPIKSTHDILNAFDAITYQKGAGVIGMFERYLGAGVFQQGVRKYMQAHAYGNASTADLLTALGEAAGRDVATPFNTFLTQPGVPLVQTRLACLPGELPRLELKQSRYLPIGSSGQQNQTWQIPICARYESAGAIRENCTLLTEPSGALTLDGGRCPSWVMPNADGAGYYRFTLAPADLAHLREQGFTKLSARERYVLGRALMAGFEAHEVSAADLLDSFQRFAGDEERMVATLPIPYLHELQAHWLGRPTLSNDQRAALAAPFAAYVRSLYAPILQRLGMNEHKDESGDTKLLRASVLAVLCDLGEDTLTRRQLARAGLHYLGIGGDGKLHPEALAPELLDLGVRIAVEDGDENVFDAVYERLRQSNDATERGRYLSALGSVRDARSGRALALPLDPVLRVNELMLPLRRQLADYRTRAAAYAWFEQHFDALLARLSASGLGNSPWLASWMCDGADVQRVQEFWKPRVEKLPGAPRSLSGTIEAIKLCAALYGAEDTPLDAYFLSR
jgi:alanyl aminopeptidase